MVELDECEQGRLSPQETAATVADQAPYSAKNEQRLKH